MTRREVRHKDGNIHNHDLSNIAIVGAKAEPKRPGRPPVADPWAILRVSVRASDLARIKAAHPEPSPWAREIILRALDDHTPPQRRADVAHRPNVVYRVRP